MGFANLAKSCSGSFLPGKSVVNLLPFGNLMPQGLQVGIVERLCPEVSVQQNGRRHPPFRLLKISHLAGVAAEVELSRGHFFSARRRISVAASSEASQRVAYAQLTHASGSSGRRATILLVTTSMAPHFFACAKRATRKSKTSGRSLSCGSISSISIAASSNIPSSMNPVAARRCRSNALIFNSTSDLIPCPRR